MPSPVKNIQISVASPSAFRFESCVYPSVSFLFACSSRLLYALWASQRSDSKTKQHSAKPLWKPLSKIHFKNMACDNARKLKNCSSMKWNNICYSLVPPVCRQLAKFPFQFHTRAQWSIGNYQTQLLNTRACWTPIHVCIFPK